MTDIDSHIECCDSRDIPLDDETVQLTVTSPPYNIGKEYDEADDNLTLEEWKSLVRDVFEEVWRVSKPDAKLVVNVMSPPSPTESGDKNRFHLHSLSSEIHDICTDIGWDYYDEAVWTKNTYANSGGGALFGSYPHPTNLMLNLKHEWIMVFRKYDDESYYRTRNLPDKEVKEKSKLTKEEWREYCQSVWDDIGVDKRDDHPAPFPVDLARRPVRLYSFKDDIVLDPFAGVGSTCVAAEQTGRRYVGYDISETYVQTARNRVTEESEKTAEE